ncbi:hypothetical protein [Cupriavidus yeoncheonensis]|uniref:hypothetical protein n=1 Tax=Cupriavidus yeoncheonensis TaxID=1462994 RepID=UPI001E2F77BB|nr:hypothetical protein [Cupriavidus yeoncheonensis]
MKIATERVPTGRPDQATGGDTPWPPQFGPLPPCAAGMTAFSENALDDTVIGAALAIEVHARQSAVDAENSNGLALIEGSCSRFTGQGGQLAMIPS